MPMRLVVLRLLPLAGFIVLVFLVVSPRDTILAIMVGGGVLVIIASFLAGPLEVVFRRMMGRQRRTK